MTDSSGTLPERSELASTGGFNAYIGPLYRLPDEEDGSVKRFCFIAAPHHMNASGTVHGGMLMSFIDVSMSRTTRLVTGAKRTATVSLATDFVGPGRLGEVIQSRVRISRRTRTMLFLAAEIFTSERMLAVANGLWKVSEAA